MPRRAVDPRLVKAAGDTWITLSAHGRAIHPPFDGALAQQRGRVFPERLREGVARNQAMGALREVAVDAASTVVTRLTGHPADPASVQAAVGEVMTARAA